ncbi:MAG: hypothetical protein V3T57_07145 [Kiloniellales bacterium]|jgi:hypothetical protein
MAKQGSPFDSPAALAEWLPLLGAICQVLASISEAAAGEGESAAAQGPTRPAAARAAQNQAG